MGGLAAAVGGLSFEEGLRFDEEQRAAVEPQDLPPWACACVPCPRRPAPVALPPSPCPRRPAPVALPPSPLELRSARLSASSPSVIGKCYVSPFLCDLLKNKETKAPLEHHTFNGIVSRAPPFPCSE